MKKSPLIGECRQARLMTEPELGELFSIFAGHYDHVRFDQFRADFSQKDYVILLRDGETGFVHGFSTIALYDRIVQGAPVKLLFSGDTIVDHHYWGQQTLVKTWCQTAGRLRDEFPGQAFYWLLISKGYRTYLYLPLFLKDFYPRYDRPTPSFEQAVLDDFGAFRYPHAYNPRTGTLVFKEPAGQLKTQFADISQPHLKNRHVQFFLGKNPGYRKGDELVCTGELSPENMKSLAKYYFSNALNYPKAA